MKKRIATSGLGKPIPLQEVDIVREVDNSTDWSSASVFVVGGIRKSADGKFRFQIRKVSHVDGDLGKELRKYIGKYLWDLLQPINGSTWKYIYSE